MKITIIGATRGIGKETLIQALKAGHQVTVLARNPEKIEVNATSLTLISGDFLDRDSLKKAVLGADTVIVSVGAQPGFKPVSLFSEGTRLLLDILKEHNEDPLLIVVTGIGAGDSAGHGGFMYDKIFKPLLLGRIYEDKDRQEALLRENYKNRIIVRPGMLTNGPLRGTRRALTDLTGIHGGKISRRDVAAFILKQCQKPSFVGQAPLLIY